MAEPISILGFAATELATMACLVLAALLEICAAAVNNWQMTEVKDKNGSFKATMGLFKWCETIATKPYPAVETCTSIVWNAKGSSELKNVFAVRAMVLLVPFLIALSIAIFIWFKKRTEKDPFIVTIILISVAGVCAITGVSLYSSKVSIKRFQTPMYFGPGFGLACASCAFLIIADIIYAVGKKMGWN